MSTEKISLLNKIKEIYDNGDNIIKYLKKIKTQDKNTIEDILISYDFQAGSYSKYYKEQPSEKNKYCKSLAEIINGLGDFSSLLEVGVGEATTLGPTILHLNSEPNISFGFDISWSRLKYAQRLLHELEIKNVNLVTGDLFNSPIKNNSIDIVYTSHSIEPNGGREKEALEELYRITNKYLILLEPAYELANEEARARMLEHGYVTSLYSTAKELGYEIIEHRLFEVSANPLNPTGLIVIKKKEDYRNVNNPICCPITKTDLRIEKGAYFSKDALLAYPIIDDIPCLTPQNAIVATKFLD